MITKTIIRIGLGASLIAVVSIVLYGFGSGLQALGFEYTLQMPAILAGIFSAASLWFAGWLLYMLGDLAVFVLHERLGDLDQESK